MSGEVLFALIATPVALVLVAAIIYGLFVAPTWSAWCRVAPILSPLLGILMWQIPWQLWWRPR